MMMMISQEYGHEPGSPTTPTSAKERQRHSMRRASQNHRDSIVSMLAEEEACRILTVQHRQELCCIGKLVEIGPDELQEAFSRFDTDGSGQIDKDEALSLMTNVYGETEGKRYAEQLILSDKNEDGQISFDEFKQFMALKQVRTRITHIIFLDALHFDKFAMFARHDEG